MSDRQKCTVGWICAIHTENVAATVFLDKEHEKPDVPPNDNNAYTVGEIWKHNVVIAVLPAGEYGTASAASVARDMVHAFPNIRIGLMVGIGGGVPTKRDIRLGDVVVSYPQDGYSGVFQYDFGKTHQDKRFQCTGFLDQPPAVLRAALSTLRSRYEIYGHHIEKDIEGVFEKVPRLRKNYSRPESSSDRLFNSEVLHEVACTTCCSEDVAKLRWRPERTEEEDNPAIHYGLIASGNQLMKDAMIRDKLAEEKGVLCFEMEAAGLMNHFPCLVIRGICDYSDSHKNKKWQGYAAMVAAAYAKDLLHQIHPNDVGKEQKITDVLPGEDESKAISHEVNHVIRHRVKGLSSRLPTEAVTYLEKRLQEGTHRTYLWVYLVFNYLEMQNYKRTLIAVKAIIKRLPNSVNEAYEKILSKSGDDAMIMKALSIILAASRPLTVSEMNVALNVEQSLQSLQDLDLEPEKQFTTRLRSQCGLFISIYDNKIHFLHQTAREFLIAKASTGEVVAHDSRLRWQESITTQKAHFVLAELCVLYLNLFNAKDTEGPYSGSPTDLSDTTGHGTDHRAFLDYSARFWTAHFREANVDGDEAIVQFLMKICDPGSECYAAWHKIHIRSFEYFGPYHLNPLLIASYHGFCGVLKKLLDEGADVNERDPDSHRPLLSWAIENRQEGVVKLLLSNKALELNAEDRTDLPKEYRYGRTPLSDAIESNQLSIVKLLVAEERVNINRQCMIYDDLYNEVWGTPLLISLFLGHESIALQLLHRSDIDVSGDVEGIHGNESRRGTALFFATVMKSEILVRLLLAKIGIDINDKGNISAEDLDDPSYSGTPFFVAVASGLETIVRCLLEMKTIDIDIEGSIDDPICGSYQGTPFFVAVARGHASIVKLLLDKKTVDLDMQGSTANYQGPPLFVAAAGGHETIVRCLIATHGIDLNAQGLGADDDVELEWLGHKFVYQGTPLSIAALRGDETIVGILLTEQDVDVNVRTYIKHRQLKENMPQFTTTTRKNIPAQGTPLFFASARGEEEMVRLLLTRDDINLDCKGCVVDYYGYWGDCDEFDDLTYVGGPLPMAAWTGWNIIVEMLLAKIDVDVNAQADIRYCRDRIGGKREFIEYSQATPLILAAAEEKEDIVMLLLGSRRTIVDARDENGRTPLMWATYRCNTTISKVLIEYGADINAKDNSGCTPIFDAIGKGSIEMVKLLLENRADIYVKNNSGCTPVVYATRLWNWDIVGLLLNHAANEDLMNNSNCTPISCTLREDDEDMVDLVLQ
ncbi:hypothetical protein CBS63078_390 [Aspergillus niger]|nr:hypothetical protein CBS63078_390 [Aspergillus niger]